jgi:hypothetical protein
MRVETKSAKLLYDIEQQFQAMNQNTNKKTKYNNQKIKRDEYVFDSKLEESFYRYFKDNPDIELLEVHPKIELLPTIFEQEKGKRGNVLKRQKVEIGKVEYTPDFLIKYNNEEIFVDAKGVETSYFKLKMNLYKRLMYKRLIIAKSIQELTNYL